MGGYRLDFYSFITVLDIAFKNSVRLPESNP